MIRYDLYIDGNWQKPSSGNYFESDNPYSGEVWAEIAKGNEEDVNLAVIAAKNAFEEQWEPMKPTERGKILVRLAELIERDAVRLGEIEVKDNGKLFAEMGAQTKYLAEWYRYFGGLADKVEGAVIPIDKPGLLVSANNGPNTNNSQFFITTSSAQHLDGKHVVFGQCLDDKSLLVVRKVENVSVGGNHKPRLNVVISECGEL